MKTTVFLITSLFLSTLSFSQEGISNKDTVTTESGLKYIIVKMGNGEETSSGKEIGLHGIGSFLDNGEVFWETRKSNNPFYFVMGTNSVIKGCEEGVGLMRKGDRYIFIMPPELAYGEKGRGSIPPNAILVFDYEVIYVDDPKVSIIDTLKAVINKNGIESTIALYHNLRKNHSDVYDFREGQLNRLGYMILRDKVNEAIEIFKLNVQVFPESYNVYDSLGEAYLLAGNKELAIKNYKKSLELYPDNTNAVKVLENIEKGE